jgi:transposase
MAHFHIKQKNGRPYLYVREVARVGGKPKVVSQTYIGAPDRVKELVNSQAEEVKLRVEEFGAVWLANEIDRRVGLAEIIDSVIPRDSREKGPSIGEYFVYAVINRMIEPQSKRGLADWFKNTAVREIRPVDVSDLSSERFWEKWNRVSESDLEIIINKFFEKIRMLEKIEPDCVLFDTTNYYTYMASDTPSELAKRGNNKDSKHHLRQIGLAMLACRGDMLPLYYQVYPGNLHDSKEFRKVIENLSDIVWGINGSKKRLTIVVDKGMNSEDNFAMIDNNRQIHFITTYSTHYSEELTNILLDKFSPVKQDDGDDREPVLAYRTTGEYWGADRTVVITYNPRTARKQSIVFEEKMDTLREELLQMRSKVNAGQAHWKSEESVRERYVKICEQLHVSTAVYELSFEKNRTGLKMAFRQNVYWMSKHTATFGKSIIITDNNDWATDEIVKANLDRWQIELQFRQSKDEDHVCTMPIRHWTDGQIRCHLFTCVAAITYIRLLERILKNNKIQMTGAEAIEKMKTLHSVLMIRKTKPIRQLEEPSKTQMMILKTMGYYENKSGGLQM